MLEQTQAELARAREDHQAERERRAGDGERFREGLAQVRAAAEDAVNAEQVTITELRAELQEAQTAAEEKDAALAAMRTQLEAAEANAQTETEALRERVAKFEHAPERGRRGTGRRRAATGPVERDSRDLGELTRQPVGTLIV